MTESAHPDQPAAPTAEVASGQLPGVGARLRQAREMRSLSVSDIALSLKLGTRQIEALEDGDWEVLPGQTFIRGFVRNYARVLQIFDGALNRGAPVADARAELAALGLPGALVDGFARRQPGMQELATQGA